MQGFTILEVNITNILHSADVHVKLDAAKPVTVMQCTEDGLLTPLSFAIELMCTAKYQQLQSLEWVRKHFGSTMSVQIVFHVTNIRDAGNGDVAADDVDDAEPCTSQQARAREEARRQCQTLPQLCVVRAKRDFLDPTNVEYAVNNGLSICTAFEVYYKRFFKAATYVLPRLLQLHRNCGGNWVPLLAIKSILGVNPSQSDPFKTFARLFLEKAYAPDDFLVNLVSKCLKVADVANSVRLNYLLRIFKNVRTIFEFITCQEYTIWFYVPKRETYQDANQLTLGDLDFGNIQSRIQLNVPAAEANAFEQHFEPEEAIKDMLLLSFHLCLANYCGQKIVLLRNLTSLRNYLTLRYTMAAYVQQSSAASGVQWTYHNYLQRIIDACFSLKLVAFIEYPGGLPLVPKNANLIKCVQHPVSGEWNIRTEHSATDSDIKNFIDALNGGLRQR